MEDRLDDDRGRDVNALSLRFVELLIQSRQLDEGKCTLAFLHPFSRWLSCHFYFWKFCKLLLLVSLEISADLEISARLHGYTRFDDSFGREPSPQPFYLRSSFIKVIRRITHSKVIYVDIICSKWTKHKLYDFMTVVTWIKRILSR